MLLAGVGEGEAEVDEAAGEVFEGDGDFLPLVPVAGGLELGGSDFFVVGSHGDGGSGAGGGVVEGDLLAASEAEAMILRPLVVVDGSDEGFAVLGGFVEQFRASVFGKVFGLNGAGLQSDGGGAGEGRSLTGVGAEVGVIGGEFERALVGRRDEGAGNSAGDLGCRGFAEGVDPADHRGDLIAGKIGMGEHWDFSPDFGGAGDDPLHGLVEGGGIIFVAFCDFGEGGADEFLAGVVAIETIGSANGREAG